jgi:hypothetical protein
MSYKQKRDNSTDETEDTCEQQQNISMVQSWGKTTGRTMPHQQRTRSRGKGNQHPQEQKVLCHLFMLSCVRENGPITKDPGTCAWAFLEEIDVVFE